MAELEPGPDGLFSVCIHSASQAPDNEINDIFGEFGEIHKMHRVKPNLVFVRYAAAEEARACVESMRGHGKFNCNYGKRKSEGTSESFKRPDTMSRNENGFGKRSEGSRGGSYGRDGGDKENGFDRKGRQSEPGAHGSENGFNRRSGSSFGRDGGSGDGLGPPPGLITLPPSILHQDPDKEDQEEPTEEAKLVVMGNLHPRMLQSNIYELCTKANCPPLHVAMKTHKKPHYPTLHYALVYLDNDTEVDTIINAFNNMKLNGYQMIVKRPDDLVESYDKRMAGKGN